MSNHYGNIIAHKDDLEVMDCVVCGYAHLYPLPNASEILDNYTKDKFYTSARFTEWFTSEALEYRANLMRPSFTYQSNLLERSLGLIDVGCGVGWFNRHWELTTGTISVGVEPSPTSRLNKVCTYMVQDIDELNDKFQWIKRLYCNSLNVRMSLVLEHVVEPEKLLWQYKDFLGDFGKIMVKVPHDGPYNPLQSKIHGNWWVDRTHVNYFSKKSIKRVFAMANLRVTHMSTTFPIELAQLLGWKYIGDNKVGTEVHRWRLNFERKLGPNAFRLYNVLYKLFGIGRELIVVGESVNL